MTSMGLPIASQGTPPTAGTSNFGQPAGVVLGQPASQYGSVQSTVPAGGYQNTVSPRSNVRFDVQPQCTIAVKPAIPLPEGTRRKDYMLTVNVPRTDSNRAYINLRKTGHQGTIVCGVQQANAALFEIQDLGYKPETPLARLILSGLDHYHNNGMDTTPQQTFQTLSPSDKLARIHRTLLPFGVYNNRGTFDGQAPFAQETNSNVGNIIGVNISNYCFMRDIWGVELKQGDALELWYIYNRLDDIFEIFPVAGCADAEDGQIDPVITSKKYGSSGIIPQAVADNRNIPILRHRIGFLWAKPIHAGFQRTSKVNIVGYAADADTREVSFGNVASPPAVYKNIEVELSADCML